jgi:acyl dehydratase
VAGLYFDQFQVGRLFKHAIRRTVTEADNVFFTALTPNPAALHLDERAHNQRGELVASCKRSALMLKAPPG